MRTADGAFTVPCRASGQCNHRKHGSPKTSHKPRRAVTGTKVAQRATFAATVDLGRSFGRTTAVLFDQRKSDRVLASWREQNGREDAGNASQPRHH